MRGSQIRFVIIPNMLRNAPMFKRFTSQSKKIKGAPALPRQRARGAGKGKGPRKGKPSGKEKHDN